MIDIELTGDLIDTCHPGDVVSVCGIIKVLPVTGENGNRNDQTQKSLHHLYIDANSVLKGSKGFSTEETINMMKPLKFRREEIATFKKIAQDDNAFSIIVKSLCPSIYGNDIIKAGLTLILFGGRSGKDSNHQENQHIRSDLHCLLVGDPGLGKSQMLKSICDLSPRGVYVSGNSSSAAGLTVTVVKEQGSGDYSLEAGALVLGDQVNLNFSVAELFD
jgi:DNA helicase MCM8